MEPINTVVPASQFILGAKRVVIVQLSVIIDVSRNWDVLKELGRNVPVCARQEITFSAGPMVYSEYVAKRASLWLGI